MNVAKHRRHETTMLETRDKCCELDSQVDDCCNDDNGDGDGDGKIEQARKALLYC